VVAPGASASAECTSTSASPSSRAASVPSTAYGQRPTRSAPSAAPIDAPCPQYLRHGNPMHAQERLTVAAVAAAATGAINSAPQEDERCRHGSLQPHPQATARPAPPRPLVRLTTAPPSTQPLQLRRPTLITATSTAHPRGRQAHSQRHQHQRRQRPARGCDRPPRSPTAPPQHRCRRRAAAVKLTITAIPVSRGRAAVERPQQDDEQRHEQRPGQQGTQRRGAADAGQPTTALPPPLSSTPELSACRARRARHRRCQRHHREHRRRQRHLKARQRLAAAVVSQSFLARTDAT
jgi:hypothetical protein